MHSGEPPRTRPIQISSSHVDEAILGRDIDGTPVGYYDSQRGKLTAYTGAGMNSQKLHRSKIPGASPSVASHRSIGIWPSGIIMIKNFSFDLNFGF